MAARIGASAGDAPFEGGPLRNVALWHSGGWRRRKRGGDSRLRQPASVPKRVHLARCLALAAEWAFLVDAAVSRITVLRVRERERVVCEGGSPGLRRASNHHQ